MDSNIMKEQNGFDNLDAWLSSQLCRKMDTVTGVHSGSDGFSYSKSCNAGLPLSQKNMGWFFAD
jgi:hypothetical protein